MVKLNLLLDDVSAGTVLSAAVACHRLNMKVVLGEVRLRANSRGGTGSFLNRSSLLLMLRHALIMYLLMCSLLVYNVMLGLT